LLPVFARTAKAWLCVLSGVRSAITVLPSVIEAGAMGAASVSEITLFRRLPNALLVYDIIITAPPSVIGD
jgi:hypothetical protein